MSDLFLPRVARIAKIRDETPDTKTYWLEWRDEEAEAEAGAEKRAQSGQPAQERFRYRPGQFLELSVFGHGEAPFCIASTPTRDVLQITVRRTGKLTDALHELGVGFEVGVRGPFGNGFDVDGARGKNLLFVAGGIGLPPLRSFIWNAIDERKDFGEVTILYGARTPTDLVYQEELDEWAENPDVELRVTVDRGEPGWTGNVGMVPVLFEQVTLLPETTLAYVCGPPIMIKFVVQDLLMRGFAASSVISTLERTMQCGVGKCNHCAIGHRYVCVDGPVFDFAQIQELVE